MRHQLQPLGGARQQDHFGRVDVNRLELYRVIQIASGPRGDPVEERPGGVAVAASVGFAARAAELPAAAMVRFIEFLKSSGDSGVGCNRYLSTKAATPWSASAFAIFQPSLLIESQR